jgi:hypothetical protein
MPSPSDKYGLMRSWSALDALFRKQMGIIQFHAIADANEFNDAQKGTVIGR